MKDIEARVERGPVAQNEPFAIGMAKLLDREGKTVAAAELRRLQADAEESEALRERLSALLSNTAIALRGPEPELTRWSWHDLPERATALKAQRDALLEVLRNLLAEADDAIATCPLTRAAARAAIKAVEETK